jgi:hypothetical protein
MFDIFPIISFSKKYSHCYLISMSCPYQRHNYFYLLRIIKTHLQELIFVFILIISALYLINFKVNFYAHYLHFVMDYNDVN